MTFEAVNDVDLSRAESREELESSGGRSNDGRNTSEVLEHLKSNLKMYLGKTPIIDAKNETSLHIVFSMLNLTKEEIEMLKETRALLPIYKIDEKGTKKAQKNLKTSTGG